MKRNLLIYNGRRLCMRRCKLPTDLRVVAIGGGTGLSAILRGLKKVALRTDAIVTVTDDGGSSGRLVNECSNALPPGDIRNCLAALAPEENMMAKMLQYRFEQPHELAGHSLGNLLLSALSDIEGDLTTALQRIERVLNIRGRVLPVTLEKVQLGAILDDGGVQYGETAIVSDRRAICEVFLLPSNAAANPAALAAIEAADVIFLGPGSLYSSIIPNLLVPGVIDALFQARAPVYLIANIMTQPGETDGYDLSDHIAAITRLSTHPFLTGVIVNNRPVSPEMQEKYSAENAYPVDCDLRAARREHLKVFSLPLLKETEYVQHDGDALAQLLLALGR